MKTPIASNEEKTHYTGKENWSQELQSLANLFINTNNRGLLFQIEDAIKRANLKDDPKYFIDFYDVRKVYRGLSFDGDVDISKIIEKEEEHVLASATRLYDVAYTYSLKGEYENHTGIILTYMVEPDDILISFDVEKEVVIYTRKALITKVEKIDKFGNKTIIKNGYSTQ